MPSQWVGPVRIDLGTKTTRGAQCAAVFVAKSLVITQQESSQDPTRMCFKQGALPALRRLTDAGYRLVLLAQQREIPFRGFDEAEARQSALAMRDQAAGQGIPLHGFFACPHAPGPFGRPACLCRMPEPGLLRAAKRALGLSLPHSWSIGGSLDDALAAHAATCRTVLLDPDKELERRSGAARVANAFVSDLDDATETILLHDSPGKRAA